MVFRTDRVRLSSRFRRSLRGSRWQVRADTAFEDVVAACADAPRAGQRGTWITSAMRDAYVALHRLGLAHSVGACDDERLVGGKIGRPSCRERGVQYVSNSVFGARVKQPSSHTPRHSIPLPGT